MAFRDFKLTLSSLNLSLSSSSAMDMMDEDDQVGGKRKKNIVIIDIVPWKLWF